MNEEQTVIHKRVPVITDGPRERNAYLIVLSGRAVGKMYKLAPGEHTLGRSTDADIRLDDEGVSRLHATMRRRSDGTVEVSDLESTNGTYVNGSQIRHFTLSDGDRIQIGSVTILKFSYQDSLEEQFQQQLYESATRDPPDAVVQQALLHRAVRKGLLARAAPHAAAVAGDARRRSLQAGQRQPRPPGR